MVGASTQPPVRSWEIPEEDPGVGKRRVAAPFLLSERRHPMAFEDSLMWATEYGKWDHPRSRKPHPKNRGCLHPILKFRSRPLKPKPRKWSSKIALFCFQ